MPFNFLNLDKITRDLMDDELNYDIKCNNTYVSNRLNSKGKQIFLDLLRESIKSSNEVTFANSMQNNDCFLETYKRKTKNGYTDVKMPYDAPVTLAEGEFNRFYIRALARRAMDEDKLLEVYRAKEVQDPRPESEAIIGEKINNPKELLEDLRNNIGRVTILGVPAGPNSGISVKLV